MNTETEKRPSKSTSQFVRISGVNVPAHKHARIALQFIFGVGLSVAIDICNVCDINLNTRYRLGLLFLGLLFSGFLFLGLLRFRPVVFRPVALSSCGASSTLMHTGGRRPEPALSMYTHATRAGNVDVPGSAKHHGRAFTHPCNIASV